MAVTPIRRRDPYVRLLFGAAAAAMALLAVLVPGRFLHADNFASMAIQMSELGLYSVAMTLSLLIGGIDLSVVAVANLAAILAALTVRAMVPAGAGALTAAAGFTTALIVALATGVGVGAINGLLIARLGVPAILATLGTMTFFSGIAFGVTGGSAMSGLPDSLTGVGDSGGRRRAGVVPGFPAVWLAADVLVRRTAFGAEMILVGTSVRVARFSGIATGRVVFRTHLLTALIASIAGFSSLMRTNSANADYGGTYVLLAILVSVLGGVSVTGGSGRLIGVLWALVILQLLSTGFNMLLLFRLRRQFFPRLRVGFLAPPHHVADEPPSRRPVTRRSETMVSSSAPKSRKAYILERISAEDSISVAALAETLSVSEMTIRRDLAALEREGLLKRVHGGAVSGFGRSYEPPYALRAVQAVAAKQAIARAAAAMVSDGDSVALDVGSTVYEIARLLSHRRGLTVITPSVRVLGLFLKNKDVRTIVSGGVLRTGEESLVGRSRLSRLPRPVRRQAVSGSRRNRRRKRPVGVQLGRRAGKTLDDPERQGSHRRGQLLEVRRHRLRPHRGHRRHPRGGHRSAARRKISPGPSPPTRCASWIADAGSSDDPSSAEPTLSDCNERS